MHFRKYAVRSLRNIKIFTSILYAGFLCNSHCKISTLNSTVKSVKSLIGDWRLPWQLLSAVIFKFPNTHYYILNVIGMNITIHITQWTISLHCAFLSFPLSNMYCYKLSILNFPSMASYFLCFGLLLWQKEGYLRIQEVINPQLNINKSNVVTTEQCLL